MPENPKPETANVHFNEQGTLVADGFDDVYFSNDDGYQETLYVFLHQNDLPQRWKEKLSSRFVIGETGFGTGLNFLVAWNEFNQHAHPHNQLHFVSVEKYPLAKEHIQQALRHWPQLKELLDQLLEQYDAKLSGCQRFVFDQGRVILDLWIGDLHQMLPQMHCTKQGLVDAWFLDGFAPSKNPDMWSDALFNQLPGLSKANATLATFTAAGVVKRGLKNAGFEIKKVKGFGRKRDMLTATLAIPNPKKHLPTWTLRSGPKQDSLTSPIVIIGGGLAAANLCYSFAQRGIQTILLCKDQAPAQGASGNRQGGFYPLLQAEASPQSRIFANAFEFARRRYQSLLDDGFTFDHDFCGVIAATFSDVVDSRHDKLVENNCWPQELVNHCNKQEVTDILGLDINMQGLHFRDGGWINPKQLTHALLDYAQSKNNLTIKCNHKVTALNRLKDGIELEFEQKSPIIAKVVIDATGHHANELTQIDDVPVGKVRGQVEHINASDDIKKLKAVFCHKGYLTPQHDGLQVCGATFEKNVTNEETTPENTERNLELLQQGFAQSTIDTKDVSVVKSRASIRATSPDHLPMVGAIPDATWHKHTYEKIGNTKRANQFPYPNNLPGLYMMSALGSRGLCSAPLLSEILVSEITHEPLPLESDLLKHLLPSRFLLRKLIRGIN